MRDAYTVKESNWVLLLAAPWALFTAFFIVGTIMTWHEGVHARIMMIGFCMIFAALGMVIVLATVTRGLHVMGDGKQLIYSAMFGRKRAFCIKDISRIESRYIRPLDWEYYIILDTNGNKLCTLETHMMRLDRLFTDMESSGIPVNRI